MEPPPRVPVPGPSEAPRSGSAIGGMRVDAGTYATSAARVLGWAARGESRYVCIANVHMVMEARDSAAFLKVVNEADLVTSDGMPLVWVLRWRGFKAAERVYGPDLMLHVCAAAERAGVPVGMFGGTTEVLAGVAEKLRRQFPKLRVVLKLAPAFGGFSPAQNEAYARDIAASGARIVFVGLGCPKQESWMAAIHDRVPAVLLGVGAAFNFHAGHVRQSPAWMQRIGMEWLFRLAVEPRRLWRRYLWHNPRFVWAVFCEEVGRHFRKA